MSGDVTYQALKRLTFLREREDLDNGSVIAGQPYDDIYFIGGEISNVTIDGLTTFLQTREVITAGDIDQLATDSVIVVENNASTAVNVNLLPSSESYAIIIKDGLGNAGAHNITVLADGAETIDGQSTAVLTFNYQWIELVPITGGWSVIG